MKFSLLVAAALVALFGAAHAQDANEVREASKAEVDVFNARVFAGPPGDKAYACFVRRYDAEHLAKHPKQKVASMKLLVSSEYDKEDKELHYSFRLGFKYRHRTSEFDSSGSCNHHVVKVGDEVRFGCGVDCDGGGIEVALSKDDKSTLVRLQRIRVWQNNKPDEDDDDWLEAGADDKSFRLDRTNNAECASLVTNRKELAALRHK